MDLVALGARGALPALLDPCHGHMADGVCGTGVGRELGVAESLPRCSSLPGWLEDKEDLCACGSVGTRRGRRFCWVLCFAQHPQDRVALGREATPGTSAGLQDKGRQGSAQD